MQLKLGLFFLIFTGAFINDIDPNFIQTWTKKRPFLWAKSQKFEIKKLKIKKNP